MFTIQSVAFILLLLCHVNLCCYYNYHYDALVILCCRENLEYLVGLVYQVLSALQGGLVHMASR